MLRNLAFKYGPPLLLFIASATGYAMGEFTDVCACFGARGHQTTPSRPLLRTWHCAFPSSRPLNTCPRPFLTY